MIMLALMLTISSCQGQVSVKYELPAKLKDRTLKQQVEEHVINTCPVDERTQLCDILDGVLTL